MPYLYLAMIIGMSFLVITGLRLKDNGALGISIFFIIAIPILFLGEHIVSQIFGIAHAIFGIYFSLGYFRPFKEEVENIE